MLLLLDVLPRCVHCMLQVQGLGAREWSTHDEHDFVSTDVTSNACSVFAFHGYVWFPDMMQLRDLEDMHVHSEIPTDSLRGSP